MNFRSLFDLFPGKGGGEKSLEKSLPPKAAEQRDWWGGEEVLVILSFSGAGQERNRLACRPFFLLSLFLLLLRLNKLAGYNAFWVVWVFCWVEETGQGRAARSGASSAKLGKAPDPNFCELNEGEGEKKN